ncbi:Nif11-like leader peptide family natural product precursor [Nostoc sp. UCD121]|uniref:Nif11-like leader peptide family natural product precursor n=1 Tax=unclassified Nostoc TaxID=2593658 RepID=UPI001627D75B|nr:MULTISPECIES: Nif11-like leader peptide family natural product precursor [unclassified Nostoc]MBC1225080.1 Nif11-like leader peptide family natural product precursor [Nostoc sp. UCD120]MBC1278378.1 Nif11-like leader peptide family natural product precursor [Nostoc sp. UCD121]
MSLENVKAFYSRLANDEAFRITMQGVKSKDECSQIVKEAGYDFTQEQFEEYTAQLLEQSSDNDSEIRDLNQKELEAVFGGASSIIGKPIIRPLYGVIVWPPVQAMYGVVISDNI